MKIRPLAPKGGNDRVYTPDNIAKIIVDHFRPSGRLLEPCKGKGAFLRALGSDCDWCEIDDGKDFFAYQGKVDWIVTNPPWSLIRPFLAHSMKVADNVVFLCLVNAFFMKARQRDIDNAGFGIVEMLEIPQPSNPWPQTGFSLAATWIRKGWTGGIHNNRIYIKNQ
jgi:hypothetical protein